MKRLRNIIFASSTSFIIVACGGGSSNAVDNSGSNANNPKLYMPYSSSINPQKDKLAKTDGTQANTNIVDSSMIPTPLPNSFEAERVNNLKIYGDYLYFTSTIETGTNSFPYTNYNTRVFKTDLSNGTTVNTNTKIESTLFGSKLKYLETTNGLYLLYIDGNIKKIRKFASDGTASSITFSTLGNYAPNILTDIISDGNNLYIGVVDTTVNSPQYTDYKIVKFNTNTATFEQNSALNNIYMGHSYYHNGKIYFAGNNGSYDGLFTLNLSNNTLSLIEANKRFFKNHLVLNGYIYAACPNANGTGGLNICKIDQTSNSNSVISTSLNGTQYSGLFNFNNVPYFLSNGRLNKVNNNTVSTIASNIDVSGIGGASNAVVVASKIYFPCNDSSAGRELCQYDGATVSLAKDINVGSANSYPRKLANLNGELIFQATPDGVTNHLYKLDSNGNLTQLQ